MPSVDIGRVRVGLDQPLTIIAGPCVVEDEPTVRRTAEGLCEAVEDLPVQLIFKASYRKANRTSRQSFTGLPFATALGILEGVRARHDVPILTDVHSVQEADAAGEVADIVQVPAFLCRQTDLLEAAGATGRAVNIKKGQFLAPADMERAAEKVAFCGNKRILLTERGTTFGYHDLVVDMRGLLIMEKTGYPVIFDATHSVQQPGGEQGSSGGQPEFIAPLARAALATAAVSGVFLEVHPNPAEALSDGPSQLALAQFRRVLEGLLAIHHATQQRDGGL
ncbi:MAG: 3-deoxy-8-phosphooctulonate synthase [Candidatus Hydrogenedentota bacterium]